MMFDHLKLAVAVVLRPTVYAPSLSDEERAALAALPTLAREPAAREAAARESAAPELDYASQLSDGFPK